MATEIEPEMTGLRKRGMLASDGSYVLRPVVNDVALATDFTTKKPQITCVELWGQSFCSCAFVILGVDKVNYDFIGIY